MEQEICFKELLKGRLKGLEKFCGQLPDKSYRICDNDLGVLGKTKASRGGVKGGKEHVFGLDMGMGEGVEQGGFACIGVADQRNHWHIVFAPAVSTMIALFAHGFKLLGQAGNAVIDPAAIDFQFCFTWPSGPYATGESGKGIVLGGQHREHVLELGHLYLELPPGSGPGRQRCQGSAGCGR